VCTAHCAVYLTSCPTISDAVYINLAPPITLDISRLVSLARMASWPWISTGCVHIDITLVRLIPVVYPIVSGTVDNLIVVRNDLFVSRLHLLGPMGSWWQINVVPLFH
jgi:hypothetical protein